MADGLVFNSEKQLKDYGDKIPEAEKTAIEAAITKLKEAHKAEDMDGIDKAAEELNTAWQAASQHIYAAQQQAGADGAPQQEPAGGNDGGVADAEFEEVK
jgi:molecular chaperone DnaK